MRDPKLPSAIVAALFLLLCLVRFHVPAFHLFDEAYYVPAAKALLSGEALLNREHPPLAKAILALSIGLFGDNMIGWRAASLALLPAGLFLAMRALWHFTGDARASVILGLLLATSCLTLGLARMGTLDAPMLFFAALGACLLSRRRGNCAAAAFGLSLACKWTIAPLLPILAAMVAWHRGRSAKGFAVEFARFGIIPLAIYAMTFAPGFFVREHPLRLDEFLSLQFAMKDALLAYEVASPYAARWWELPLNLAPFWALADEVDGVWRFVVLIVNPASALLILVAILAGWRDRRIRLLLPFYLVPLLLAALSDRSSFVHQYALPMAIGLTIAALFVTRWPARWLAALAIPVAGSFAFFYPYLTAAGFPERDDGQRAVWVDQWRYVDFARWADLHRPDWEAQRRAQQACLDNPSTCDRETLEAVTPSIPARRE